MKVAVRYAGINWSKDQDARDVPDLRISLQARHAWSSSYRNAEVVGELRRGMAGLDALLERSSFCITTTTVGMESNGGYWSNRRVLWDGGAMLRVSSRDGKGESTFVLDEEVIDLLVAKRRKVRLWEVLCDSRSNPNAYFIRGGLLWEYVPWPNGEGWDYAQVREIPKSWTSPACYWAEDGSHDVTSIFSDSGQRCPDCGDTRPDGWYSRPKFWVS